MSRVLAVLALVAVALEGCSKEQGPTGPDLARSGGGAIEQSAAPPRGGPLALPDLIVQKVKVDVDPLFDGSGCLVEVTTTITNVKLGRTADAGPYVVFFEVGLNTVVATSFIDVPGGTAAGKKSRVIAVFELPPNPPQEETYSLFMLADETGGGGTVDERNEENNDSIAAGLLLNFTCPA